MGEGMGEGKKTCFVVMGFHEKTDYKASRVLDLDKTYKHIIKKAVIDAGLECIRADEIVHAGTIDVPIIQEGAGPDPDDGGQADDGVLVVGDVNPCNTCHSLFLNQ